MAIMNEPMSRPVPIPGYSIGQCATLACLLEVAAPKPGNVHRGADFEDMSLYDFQWSAVAIAPAMECAEREGVGNAVLKGVRATRDAVGTNTNLGTLLLLAPLAAVPRGEALSAGVGRVLAELTAEDSRLVYEAIRLAQPGGMGEVSEMDIHAAAPTALLAAMAAASERDLVALQYVTQFATVLDDVVPTLRAGHGRGWPLADAIVFTQLQLLSRHGDSLIARKCGAGISREAADRAAQVLECGTPPNEEYAAALADFDFWLRSDHHRRNPGTTADLIAAGLFTLLRDGELRGNSGDLTIRMI
jgi:triphosphoribosyl-dephospho-CoA synthase